MWVKREGGKKTSLCYLVAAEQVLVGLFVLVLVSSSLITEFQTAVVLALENDCSLGASIIKQNTKQRLCVANHIRPLETKGCGVQLSKRVSPCQFPSVCKCPHTNNHTEPSRHKLKYDNALLSEEHENILRT